MSKSLLEHVREKYDFVWNAATFRLDDTSDSVNFGDLVVSPPPSGKMLHFAKHTFKVFISASFDIGFMRAGFSNGYKQFNIMH